MGTKFGYYEPLVDEEELKRLREEEEKLRAEEQEKRQGLISQQTRTPQRDDMVESLDADQQQQPKYKSKQDIVQDIRKDAPDYLQGLSDQELYDYAKEINPDLDKDLPAPKLATEIFPESLRQYGESLFYEMPAYFAAIMSRTDSEKNRNKFRGAGQGIERMISLNNDIELANRIKEENPNLTNSQAMKVHNYQKESVKPLLKLAGDWLQQGRNATFEYLKNNPDALATREWMSGSKLSDTKGGFAKYVGKVVANVAPSQITTEASGALFGLTASILTRNPLLVHQAYSFGVGFAGFALEGSSHLGAGFDYLTQDRPIKVEDLEKEKMDARQYFESRGKLFFDPELKATVTPEQAYAKWYNDNYYTQGNVVIKKGMPVEEALDIVTMPALGVGILNGAIETLSTAAGVKYLTGKDISSLFGVKHYAKMVGKMEEKARLIPEVAGIGSRLKRNGGLYGVNLMHQSVAEAAEEVAQGFTDEAMGVMTWSDEPYNYYFPEIAENAFAGAIGSASRGGNRMLANTIGISEKVANFKIRNMSPKGEGVKYYVDKNENGKHQVFVKVATLNQETGKYDVSTTPITSEMSYDPDTDSSFDTEFDNFTDAYRVSELFTTWNSELTEKMHAWKYRRYVGAEVKVEKNEGKFDVNIYNADGKLLENVDSFDTNWKAKSTSKTFQNNINLTTKWHQTYGGNEKLSQDPYIKDYEDKVSKGLDTETAAKDLPDNSDETVDKRKRIKLGIQQFMGDHEGITPEDEDVISQFDDDGESPIGIEPEVIKNLAKEDPKEFKSQLDKLNIPVEDVVRDFDETFPDNAGELNDLLEGPPQMPVEEGPVDTREQPGQVEMFRDEDTPEGAPAKGRPTTKDKYANLSDVELQDLLSEQKGILEKSDKGSMEGVSASAQIKGIEKEIDRRAQEAPPKEKRITLEQQKQINEASFELKELQDMGVNITRHPTDPDRIGEIEVPQELRNKGVGTRVVNALKKEFKAKGKDFINIVAKPEAQPFWSKMGFKVYGKADKTVKVDGKDVYPNLMRYDLKEEPEMDTDEFKVRVGASKKKALIQRLDMLTSKFAGKIKYEMFDTANEDVKKLMSLHGVKDIDKASAWYYNGKVYVIGDRSTLSEPFHEFSHPFIQEIKKSNRKLFDNIYQGIVDSPQSRDFINHVASLYKEYPMDSDDFKEEVIVYALEQSSEKKYSSKNSFVKAVNKVWNWIKEKIFGKGWKSSLKVKDLEPNTSLSELADIIAEETGQTIDLTLPEIVKDITPAKLKKMIDEHVPNSQEQVIEKLNEELPYIEEYGKAKSKYLRILFNDTYKFLKRLADNNNQVLDMQSFSSVMLDSLQAYGLRESYESWAKEKFKYVKSKNERRVGDRYLPVEDITSQVVEILNEEHNNILKVGDKKYSDEKEGNTLYVKQLNVYLSEQQIKNIRAKAKRMTFNEWREFVVKRVLKKGDRLGSVVDRNGLLKDYNRLRSSLLTNGTVDTWDGKPAGFNERVNYQIFKDKGLKGKIHLVLSQKGPENKVKGIQNSRFEKITLAENNISKGKIHFISGSDVYSKDTKTGLYKESYNFFSQEELFDLEETLKENNMAIAFSRGDSDKLGIVDVDIKRAETAKEFWQSQLDAGLVRSSHVKNFMQGDAFSIAKEIAIFEAVSNIWPRYLLDSKGGSNVFKRLKIPFTPVTISQEMPSFRVEKFNPQEVMFTYKDKSFSPYKIIRGFKPKYAGDGQSITGKSMFDLFQKYHGLEKTTAKAKTVIYNKDANGNVIAIKHQHILARPDWKITDKEGNVLYTIDKKGNIKNAKDEAVDMLVTSDEAKIWDVKQNEFDVPGSSLGFTKYDEDAPNFSKHGIQIYNHVLDQAIFNMFETYYVPRMSKQIKRTYYMALDSKYGVGAERLAKWMSRISSGEAHIGRLPVLSELVKLGAGMHPSVTNLLDSLIQTRKVLPSLNLSDSNGSRYDISMDFTDELGQKEVSLSSENSRMVYQRYADAWGITLTDALTLPIDEINSWLQENEVYVMVTRYPVPHVGGSFMARVRSLHDRKSVIEMNAYDVFARLEGDNDGDEVIVEMLDPQVESVYKQYFDTIEVGAINLDRFVPKSRARVDLSNNDARISLIANATAGKMAIGEIANIQTVYGIMSNAYNYINIAGANITIKQPNDSITFPQAVYDGSKGSWRGNVKDYLRVWLQAAVDNAEYGLLGEWGYKPSTKWGQLSGQQKIYAKLIRINGQDFNPDFRFHMQAFRQFEKIIRFHKTAGHLRRGGNFENRSFKLSDTISHSNAYYSMVGDNGATREAGIMSLFDPIFTEVSIKNRRLLPVEHIAVMAAKEHEALNDRSDLFQIGDTPFMLPENAHENAHVEAIKYINEKALSMIETRMNKDNITRKSKEGQEEVSKGQSYTREMGGKFMNILSKYNDIGLRTMDVDAEFSEFKDEYHAKFKELSNTAKAAATISFLRGYLKMSDKVRLKKHANFPVAMPPVSSSKFEANLLDSNIMKIFFRQYNKSLSERRTTSPPPSVGRDITLQKIVREICK
mgnify:CR=1 FL=1